MTTAEAAEARPDWLEEVEHTADVGFRVRAPTLPVLFERAAWALFRLIADPGSAAPREVWDVAVEAPDRDALLVRWLAELNFLHQTRQVLPAAFEVIALSDTALAARVRGEALRAGLDVTGEIKAVTFNRFLLARDGDGWVAQVIVDV